MRILTDYDQAEEKTRVSKRYREVMLMKVLTDYRQVEEKTMDNKTHPITKNHGKRMNLKTLEVEIDKNKEFISNTEMEIEQLHDDIFYATSDVTICIIEDAIQERKDAIEKRKEMDKEFRNIIKEIMPK